MVNQADSIGFSEVSKLAHCEQAWDFTYNQGLPSDDGRGLRVGTAMHRFWAAWWAGVFMDGGDHWRDPWLRGEEFDLVVWLTERFLRHYGPDPTASTGLRLVATEYEGRIPSPVDGVDLTFHVDHLAEDAWDNLWVIESGLNGNEKVIVAGLQRLRDGVVVSPKPAPPTPQAAAAAPATGATAGGQ